MENLIKPHKETHGMASAPAEDEMIGTRFKSSIFDSVTPFEVLMVEEFSDLNLVIGSHIIAVHQLILASHSKLIAGKKKQLFPNINAGVFICRITGNDVYS